jgi:hypothetical protein
LAIRFSLRASSEREVSQKRSERKAYAMQVNGMKIIPNQRQDVEDPRCCTAEWKATYYAPAN